MSYEVIVKHKKVITETQRGAWTVVSRDENDRGVYGYAPDREGETTTETEVYTQVVESLDLVAVINAVNGIK